MKSDKRKGRDGGARVEEGELQAGGGQEEGGCRRAGARGAGAEDSHLWRSNHQL